MAIHTTRCNNVAQRIVNKWVRARAKAAFSGEDRTHLAYSGKSN